MRLTPPGYTRRSILAATGLAAAVGLAAPVAAQSPKKTPRTPPTNTDAIRRIDLMLATIEKIQSRIVGGGGNDILDIVLEHSFGRREFTEAARAAAIDKDTKTARTNLLSVRDIVEGDIEILEGVDDRGTVGDVLGLERSLLNQTNSAIDAVDRLGIMPGGNVT